MTTIEIAAAVEAILFTMGNSVEKSKICAAYEIENKELKEAVKYLKEKYEKEDSGIRIIELDKSLQLGTKTEMYDYLIKVAKQPKKYNMTDVLMETLSIVAYKQPVTRIEIEKIRGVSCDHAINKLLEYGLVMELGRLDAPGRPLLFGTTEEFLRSFGVTSIDELPIVSPERVEEFKKEAEEEITVNINV